MNTSRLAAAIVLVLLLLVAASWRQDLQHMPRVRVGPLHTDMPGKAELRFFALGDTGTGGPDQYKVAAAMNERCRQGGVDGVLLLGDNAYPAGMASVQDGQWQHKIIQPYSGDCLGQVPIYAVLGNHDYKQNPAAEIEFTLLNPRWHMPNRFYSVAFGSLLKIVALDSNMADVCFTPAFCSLDFLHQSLQQHDTTWTLVMAHHPIESSSNRGFNYRGGVRGLILKPYLCQKADLYLSGHSHHLEHLSHAGCRLDMFVSGGGGGDLYEPEPRQDDSHFASAQFGFLELQLSDQQMTASFITQDGTVVYQTRKAPRPMGATL